jgi:AAA ATPase domain
MRAVGFRIQNFRNIDDSGWIPLERVTNFVGRNESGKTALLKALHKFNSATSEAYDPLKEFPRDRYTRDYVAGGSNGGNWPVCSVKFELPEDLRRDVQNEGKVANLAILTRHYDNSLTVAYEPPLQGEPLSADHKLGHLMIVSNRQHHPEDAGLRPRRAGSG